MRSFDADMSGTVEHAELKGIFKAMNFNVSDAATDICIKRYSKRGTGQVRHTAILTPLHCYTRWTRCVCTCSLTSRNLCTLM
jgi:Ca2+-binding EF-hand superfamily protein